MRFRTAALTAISLSALSMVAVPHVQAQERPHITWVSCPKVADAPGVRCGEIEVPMDYADPHGEKITIGFFELPATDGTAENGHIFFNPGGPGASAYSLAATSTRELLPAAMRQEFGWVGVQPRGLQGSTALECGDAMNMDPVTMLSNYGGSMRAACEASRPGYTRTITTENTARDWEEVRRALALEKIDIYGNSYGTQLASVYATLFPARVDKMVLDSGFAFGSDWTARVPAAIAVAHEFFGWAAAHNDQLGLGATAREVYDRWAAQVEAESGTNPTLPPPGAPANDLSLQWRNAVKQVSSGGEANQSKSPLLQISTYLLKAPTQWAALAQMMKGEVSVEEVFAASGTDPESQAQGMMMAQVLMCNEGWSNNRRDLIPTAIAAQLTGDMFAFEYMDASGLGCQGAPPVTTFPAITGAGLATKPLQIQGTRDASTPYHQSFPMRDAMGSHLITVDSATHGHAPYNPVVQEAMVEYLRTGRTAVTWAPQEPIDVLPQG